MAGRAVLRKYITIGTVVLAMTLVLYTFRRTTQVIHPVIQNNDMDEWKEIDKLDVTLQKLNHKRTVYPDKFDLETTPVIMEITNKQHGKNSELKSILYEKDLTRSPISNTAVKGVVQTFLKGSPTTLRNTNESLLNSETPSSAAPSDQSKFLPMEHQQQPKHKTELQTNSSLNPKFINGEKQDGTHFLDPIVKGWNTTLTKLDVTDAFKVDENFKILKELTIDKLVPFFPNERTHKNFDNSTYENWLAMDFPPNSNWDQTYKTPCYADYTTAKFRCIPHIYMVGWAKSGTTDMWWYWKQHPGLVPGWKETQFLSQFAFWENHKTMKSFDELLKYYFDERTTSKQKGHPEKVMYDATATIIYDNWHWRIKQGYLGDPNIPTHTNFHYLRKIHPGAQIVVMMRNPVTRALSFYNHGINMSKNKNANLQFVYKDMPESPIDIHKFFVDSIYYFNECVKKTSLRACCHMSGWESQNWGDPKYFMTLRIGIYYIYLEEVFKNYPPNQVHLVKSEDFFETPYTTLNSLFTFLEISTNHTEKMMTKKGKYVLMSIHKYYKPLVETYTLLQQFYAPFNRRLVTMLGDQRWSEWETELNALTKKTQLTPT